MSKKRKLFVELFVQEIAKTKGVTFDPLPEQLKFAASVLIWGKYISDSKDPKALKLSNVLSEFSVWQTKGAALVYKLSPELAQHLDNISFDVPVKIAHDAMFTMCVEFPEEMVFGDDQNENFWRSVILSLYFDENRGNELVLDMVFPGYKADGTLTEVMTFVNFTLDSKSTVEQAIGEILDKMDQNFNHGAIAFAVKALFYILSYDADMEIEKGLRLLGNAKVNPLRKSTRSAYDIVNVGWELEKTLQKLKHPPQWRWRVSGADATLCYAHQLDLI